LPGQDQISKNQDLCSEGKLFKVNVEAKRKSLPKDYLKDIKMAYLEESPNPSHHAYGWIAE